MEATPGIATCFSGPLGCDLHRILSVAAILAGGLDFNFSKALTKLRFVPFLAFFQPAAAPCDTTRSCVLHDTPVFCCGPLGRLLADKGVFIEHKRRARRHREGVEVLPEAPAHDPVKVGRRRAESFDSRMAATGEFHSAAVGEDDSLFVWGCGAHGRLGTGDTTRRFAPTRVAGLPAPVRQVAAGRFHTGIVTDAGDLLMCGRGVYG